MHEEGSGGGACYQRIKKDQLLVEVADSAFSFLTT